MLEVADVNRMFFLTDVALEADGAREPHALWHDEASATLCGEPADGSLEGLGVQRHTVADATDFLQTDLIAGNLEVLYGLDVDVEVFVIAGVVLGGLQGAGIVFSLGSIVAGELVEVVLAQVGPLIIRILRGLDGQRAFALVQQGFDEDVVVLSVEC